jgi:hypothetical protein
MIVNILHSVPLPSTQKLCLAYADAHSKTAMQGQGMVLTVERLVSPGYKGFRALDETCCHTDY